VVGNYPLAAAEPDRRNLVLAMGCGLGTVGFNLWIPSNLRQLDSPKVSAAASCAIQH